LAREAAVQPVGLIGGGLVAASIAILLRETRRFEVNGPVEPAYWRYLFAEPHHPSAVVIVAPPEDRRADALVKEIVNWDQSCKVVFIALARTESLVAALRAGAHAVVESDIDSESLVDCIDNVLRGNLSLREDVARRVLDQVASRSSSFDSPLSFLSPRESVVLGLIAEGHGNKAIGGQLSISEHTVRAHVRSILTKLQVSNRVQAAALAIRMGVSS
jgi:DNA-binding NarL/FixJ family response regulator